MRKNCGDGGLDEGERGRRGLLGGECEGWELRYCQYIWEIVTLMCALEI
jgi:hypothetical protein